MNSFYNGIMVLLSMASHVLAEPIFLAAMAFCALFPILVMFLLHFGSCGRVITCKRRTRRFLHGAVISGDYRQMYYDRCIRKAPPALRMAYKGFLAGEISVRGFAELVIASLRDRRKFFLGVFFGIAAALSLLVFSVFYFVSDFPSAVLHFVITTFVALTNGTALNFLLYGYATAAEKSAVQLAEALDVRLLRERNEPLLPLREWEEIHAQEDRLRALLREVENAR